MRIDEEMTMSDYIISCIFNDCNNIAVPIKMPNDR